jgi:putative tryptophan/tyrosine transport system substrate-binding protein
MLIAPLAGVAQQQKVYTIGYLANDPDPRKSSSSFKAFIDALHELGWVEGQNIEIRVRSSGGRDEMFPGLAAEFVREKVDIIVTTGSGSTRAAKAATTSIPIVFGSAANPVEQKFVDSLARPGGNVTGLAILVQELGPKRMEVLKEMVPRATRFARFFSRTNIVRLQPAIMTEYDAAARALGVTVQHVSVAKPEDIEPAFAAAASSQIDAVIVEADAVLVVNRAKVAELALKHRLPLMGPDGRFVQVGALASYGENFASRYRSAGFLVDKILRGAKPADLPVEISSVFEMGVNLKTAKALNLAIPNSIRVQANVVVR